MADQLAITELWPLSDEEAAQKIGAFLRELQIERRTGGRVGAPNPLIDLEKLTVAERIQLAEQEAQP